MVQMLRDFLDKIAPNFEKGGKLEKLYPLYEAFDTIHYTPGHVTRMAPHVRDPFEQKRLMFSVVIALGPVILVALLNTGYQALVAIAAGAAPLDNWRTPVFEALGGAYDPGSIWGVVLMGALYYVPILLATMVAGGIVEVLFAVLRRHEVSEGFLVTGMLIPLTLPPTIPLWMVMVGTAFGIVFGKEVFGGVGMNFLNPALTARAFLFFAYPAFMSGDAPWIAAQFMDVDGFSGATALAAVASGTETLANFSWWKSFAGLIPGSMGETSALACLLGAKLLIITKVGSWRTMLGVTIGTFAMAGLLNMVGSETNSMFSVPFYWHMVLGGWALGTVYMATDPVSSAFTERGKWFYGIGIGVLVILVRVVNPAYPEGMMLAILFMNMFAPLIDYFVVRGNIQRRLARYAA